MKWYAIAPALLCIGVAWSARAGLAQSRQLRQAWAIEGEQIDLLAPRQILPVGHDSWWLIDPRVGIKRFSTAGALLGDVGRVGAGPGEYRQPAAAGAVHPDTVVVADPQLQRQTWYDRNGGVVRTGPLRVSQGEHGRVEGVACPDTRCWLWTSHAPGAVPRANEQRAYLWAINQSGELTDSLLGFDAPQMAIERTEHGFSRIPLPFQRRALLVFPPEGGVIVLHNDSVSAQVYRSPPDRPRRVVLQGLNRVRAGRTDAEAYRDSVRAGLLAELDRQRADSQVRMLFRPIHERLLASVHYPAWRQAFDYALSSSDGNLWLVLPGAGASYSRVWRRYDLNSGRILQDVTVPHRGNVAAAADLAGTLVVAECTDADGCRIAAYGPWRGGAP